MSDWDSEEIGRVAAAYRREHAALSGGPHGRPSSGDEHRWASVRLEDACLEGVLPLAALDALLHDPDGDDLYRAYVAAGPIEDVLRLHPDRYAEAVASRCASDRRWAESVQSVCMSREQWEGLPDHLRAFIPTPEPAARRTTQGKRPSQRLGRRPRRA